MKTHRSRYLPSLWSAVLAPSCVALLCISAVGCGSSGGNDNPTPPEAVIEVVSQFVDVGSRYEMNANNSKELVTDDLPNVEDLDFFWTVTGGSEDTVFDDRCEADITVICDMNEDTHCLNDVDTLCQTDDECGTFDTCDLTSGFTSSQCPDDGRCAIDEGDEQVLASFVADVAGPYNLRVAAISQDASDIDTMVLDTFPSLYVVGSLTQYGGTGGAFLGTSADAEKFAPGATYGASNPADGSILLVDTDLRVIRMFELTSGDILGVFGTTDTRVPDPVVIAFDGNGDLNVIGGGGAVQVFDGATGLLVRQFGVVVSDALAAEFSPVNGQLYVVDGRTAAGVLAYSTSGASLGTLGETGAAVTEAVDLAFLTEDDGISYDLLVADAAGDVVRCDHDGTDCGSFFTGASGLVGPPAAIATNPSGIYTDRDVMIADPDGAQIIACASDGGDCGVFGETGDDNRRAVVDGGYHDLFFAPPAGPTTTTTTTTTTSTTSSTVEF